MPAINRQGQPLILRLTDEELQSIYILLQPIRDGDRDSENRFCILFDRLFRDACSYVLSQFSMLKSQVQTDDVVQNATLLALLAVKISSSDKWPTPGHFHAYIRKVIQNMLLQFYRKHIRRPIVIGYMELLVSLDDQTCNHDDQLPFDMDRESLERALQELSELDRTLLQLRYLSTPRLLIADLSKQFERTEHTIHIYIARARLRLEKIIAATKAAEETPRKYSWQLRQKYVLSNKKGDLI